MIGFFNVIFLKKVSHLKIKTQTFHTEKFKSIYPDFFDSILPIPEISNEKNPRLTVPKGSIGIADNMCGIYNIKSPGGWNIIGRTPLSFFSIYNSPPIKIKPEDKIQFKKINKKEFFKILYEK